jgi:carbohydrate-selective porin OprB
MVGKRSFAKLMIVTALLAVGAASASPAEASDRVAGRWGDAVTRLSAPLQAMHLWFVNTLVALQTKEGAAAQPGG